MHGFRHNGRLPCEDAPVMNHRTALGALHIGALFFGLTGVFGSWQPAPAR